MKFSQNIGMQAVSALAIISMAMPSIAYAQETAGGFTDPTDAECEAMIQEMGLQDVSSAPGNGANPATPGATPTPGASPTPTPGQTPGPGEPAQPGNNPNPNPGAGNPSPSPSPAPSPSPGGTGNGRPGGSGGGAIALPTGDATKCRNGITMAQSDRAAVNRAIAQKAVLQRAARKHGIDWRLLAAIGVRETNFRNIDSNRPGDPGMGIFQLTNQPGVTRAQAHDINFAADFAARIIAQDKRYLQRKFPRLTEAQLLQATAAAYNFGVDDISGNPNTIDQGTTRNNYGQNILLLMNCFT